MPAPALEVPPTAAGLDLQRTHRTVRLARAGVWACLVAGPAAFALALTQPTTTVVAQDNPRTSPNQLCHRGNGRPVLLRHRVRRHRPRGHRRTVSDRTGRRRQCSTS
ncbi:hypothetical protein ACFV90_06445 [Streptomyces sp. NPDC059904]|uniref:hypothetical protein n=1 Tax=Streptomyces sp. NPDC059904 TaxID=3346996 RepID=UPI0036517F8C